MLIDKEDAIKAVCEACYMYKYIGEHYKDCKYYPCDDIKALEAVPEAPSGDLISRADAIEAVCDVVMDEFNTSATWGYDVAEKALSALPSAELVLQTPQAYGKSINPSNADVVSDFISRADAIEAVIEYWDGYAKPLDSWDVMNQTRAVLETLPSAEAVSREAYIKAVGYVEWLEKLIVEAETFEWLCDDTNDKEWCEKNCNYSSIQAECLRHLYEVSKGGAK